ETLAACVDRELREETGYALRSDLGEAALSPLPQAGFSSTGLTDETVHVVFAQVQKAHDAQPEPGEFIEPFELAIEDVPRFLSTNETPIGTRAQLVLEAFARRR
ncbi:NUDIX domain-containing protein, partial [Gordonibacter sp.]